MVNLDMFPFKVIVYLLLVGNKMLETYPAVYLYLIL